ncbi:katanin p80 WD40 repeat-containing subunit B1, partial [Nephila pilipes]
IIGAFNLTNVSVYIMDLRKVQPVESWIKQSSMMRTPGSSFEDADIEEDPSRMVERVEYLGSYPSDIENSILSGDIDLSKTHILGVDLSTFLPPLDDPLGLQSEASGQNPFNCTYRLTNIQGKPTMLALPMAVTHPYNYENDRMYDSNPDMMDQNSLPALQGESLKHSQSMVLPDVSQKCDLDAMHQSRNKSIGIELDDFLPVIVLYIFKRTHFGK